MSDYKNLYWQSSVDKQISIITDDGEVTITNNDIYLEQIQLDESICSGTSLIFGSCETGKLTFKTFNTNISLKGKWLNFSEMLGGNTETVFKLGRFKVNSDVLTDDRRYRNITAYDAMYDIINADVTDWYNTILPSEDSTVTMETFRKNFIMLFGLEEDTPETGLINDNMVIERTINPEQLSGKDVITAICEINACFGHINREGRFQYIYISQNIQELSSEQKNPNTISKNRYFKCKYEDFVTKSIGKLQIRQEKNDIGCIYGTGSNCYIIENNFLVYGKTSEQLNAIASKIYEKIAGITYRPFTAECIGNPAFNVGDVVHIPAGNVTINSYILKRTLKGIHGLRDSFKTEGTEEYAEKVNGIHKSIVQLKGKTNTLERTIEETKSEITDVEERLSTKIIQTVKSISMAVVNDEEGVTAEVKLFITDENDTIYEVTADKIDLNGLVSFKNLETGGETIINGDNIKTGHIDADLINAGTIRGHVGLWVISDEVDPDNADSSDISNRVVSVNVDGIYNSQHTYLNNVTIYGSIVDGNGNSLLGGGGGVDSALRQQVQQNTDDIAKLKGWFRGIFDFKLSFSAIENTDIHGHSFTVIGKEW